MKLEDLLKAIPDEKIGMQFMNQCVTSAKLKKKPHEHCELTIVTDAVNPNFLMGKSGKVGILLWIDKEAFEAAKRQGGEE